MPVKVTRQSNGWLWLMAVVMLGVLAWGLEQIAFDPVTTGDVYPPFSSLRADPLGSRALYESLEALPGVTVERLYKQRPKLGGADQAMFVLGVDPVSWSAVEPVTLVQYQKLVAEGGRLVIAFVPVRTPPSLPKERPVEGLWNIKLAYREGDDDYSTGGMRRTTALYFEAGSEWHEVAGAQAMERSFGKGMIVLLANSFPLSNEALRDARDAALIAEIAGPARHFIFDENHFGVTETGSIVKLLRRYRLQGAVAVLLVVALLFLWRSMSSLLPPRASGGARESVEGRDSLEGLAALLQRGVPEKQLLDTCFAEWSKSAPRESAGSRAASMKQEIAREGAAAPVVAYREACRILANKYTGESR